MSCLDFFSSRDPKRMAIARQAWVPQLLHEVRPWWTARSQESKRHHRERVEGKLLLLLISSSRYFAQNFQLLCRQRFISRYLLVIVGQKFIGIPIPYIDQCPSSKKLICFAHLLKNLGPSASQKPAVYHPVGHTWSTLKINLSKPASFLIACSPTQLIEF